MEEFSMSDKSKQSSDKSIHKINEGFHGIDNLNRSNYVTKGFDGIGNLKPTNSRNSGNGGLRTNGFDGISNLAPKPQSDSQESESSEK